MSLEPRYQNHEDNIFFALNNLDTLDAIATAAGHGESHLNQEPNAGWVQVELSENNVRPSYDIHFLQTFSPDMVKAMLYELSESRKALAGMKELLNQYDTNVS